MKKIEQILLLICFALIMCTSVSINSFASDKVSSGDWEYTISSDGITITAYNGDDTIIDIPSSVDGYNVIKINSYVFEDSKMTELTIPETINSIGSNAFHNCKSLKKIYFNARNCDNCNSGSSGTFYNAGADSDSLEVVFGSEVKKIPAHLFYADSATDYVHITSVKMSNSIETIGNYAFNNCMDLSSVTWGNSIVSIGSYSFEDCRKMTSVTIPKTTTSIGYSAFNDCQNLSSINFNALNCESCSSSSNGTFYNVGAKSNSLEVTFGSGVKVVPDYLFYVNADYNYGDGIYAHITNVVLSDSILTIGKSSFENCFDLKTVSWGNSIEKIGQYAFDDCTSLSFVTIPETTTSIGYRAFNNCQNLSSITFNALNCESCSGSSNGTFYNAGANKDSLTVTFGDKVKVIPNYLFYASADYNYGDGTYAHITKVKISDSIQKIGSYAFSNCYDLKSLSFGKVSTVSQYAFSNCGTLASVTFPKTVTEFGYRAFSGCSNLKKVVVKSKNAEFDSHVFNDCSTDLKLYCYRGSTAMAYAQKNGITYSYLDPAQVSISSITNTSSGVKIAWKETSKVSGYYVYRKTKDTSYKKIKTIEAKDTLSYTDTAVKDKNGNLYYYTVKAYNSYGSSSTYTSKKIVRLKAVSISKIQNQSGKKMYLEWNKNTKATGYQIQYSTSSSFKNASKVKVSGYKNVSKTISKLTKDKKYYVRIRVYKKSGDTYYYSAWSGSKSVKISK